MGSKKTFTIVSLLLVVAAASGAWAFYQQKPAFVPSPEPDVEALSEEDRRSKVLMHLIYDGLSQIHYAPEDLNDEFSVSAYDLYLKRLDINKRFFLQEDIDAMEKYRLEIDDEVRNASFELYDLSYDILVKRLEEVQGYYTEILAEPFKLDLNETVEYDEEKLAWATSQTDLKDRWRKILKYDAISRITDKLESQEKKKEEGKEVEIKTVAELEKDAREKILKNYTRWYERQVKQDREKRQSIYINSIVNVYGPHTSYFPPIDKDNFDISMSGQLEGIGARLVDEDGYITVTEVVPGSASSLQGDLEAKDQILEVAQGDEEPVNIEGAVIDDALKLIRGKKGTTVVLTVRKIDGSVMDIPIVRDVVIIDETYVKSAKLNFGKQEVGYIKLPKFYADFGGGGRSCAADVKDEVYKLKNQKVDGIILDLRRNGGGSLRDVVDMAGLFIEEGPVVQVKSKMRAPQVLDDRDDEVHYGGPLVVLIDQFSASASEIMAAAIQDYGRGVIIGSQASFGKGTVQRFIELDDYVSPSFSDVKPLGAIKVTMQKFYRINGGATQLKGVSPDIVLPDAFMFVDIGEKEQEFVMEWDNIDALPYKKWNHQVNIDKVRKASEARTAKNETFQLVQENAERLKAQSDETNYTLNLDKFRAEKEAFDKESEKYKDIFQEIDGLKVENLPEDLEAINKDDKSKELNEAWHESIMKDAYIFEAMKVIGDMK